MDIRVKMNEAFRIIQRNPGLYKQFHECVTQEERVVMLADQLWTIAYNEGYHQCDEDISMGG